MTSIPSFATPLGDASKTKLPDVGCEEFDLLIDFVDSDGTSIRPMCNIKTPDTTPEASWDAISFFSLAKRLELPSLQNLIMDTIIQYHNKDREYPSPEFAQQAYQETRKGSTVSKYAFLAVRYTLQIETTSHKWLTVGIVKLLGDNKSFATDFIGLVGHRFLKDPRKIDRDFFHAPPAPETVHPSTKNRSGQSEKITFSQNNRKRRSTDHQEPLQPKQQRIDLPVARIPVENERQIKQPCAEKSVTSTGGGASTSATRENKLSAKIWDIRRKVCDVLQHELQNSDGLHAKYIAQRAGVTVNDAFEAGDVLLGEGLIYTTVDDETWATLEY